MHLELGLNEDDDYIRLQKLTIGIKEITSSIPTLSTYNDSYSLKLLFCSYPFQQHSVELLISIILDRFKSKTFVSAFHSAICEVALQQEQRTLLSQRSLSLKSSRLTNLQNISTDSRKSSQNNPFAKQVIQKIIIAKKFASTYLKQLFVLANDLNMDLEKLAKVFKIFIINTKDQDFRIKIISIFDECKHEIFGHTSWVEQYYEEIDSYFLQNHISYPTSVQDFASDQKQVKVGFLNMDLPSDCEDSEEENDEIIIQKWLCDTETYDVMELEDILNKPDNYDELIKLITFPEKTDLAKCWTIKYQDEQQKFNDNCTYYKFMDKNLKFQETIRSYKALQVLIRDENSEFFSENIPQNVLQIFNGVYEFINDQTHNANINHIAKLIENTLYRHPKLSVVQIVDLNLYFSLSLYLYNDLIKILLEDIINIKIDKFKLGYFFQEQLWKYLCKTDWFKFITQLIVKEGINYAMVNKSTKCEATISILSILRTLSSYDKKQILVEEIDVDQKEKLTNLLGMLQAGKSPQQFYTTNQLNWQMNLDILEYIHFEEINEKDIDNLKHFVNERKNNTTIKQHFLEMKNMKQRKSFFSQAEAQIMQDSTWDSPQTSRQQKKNHIIISTRKSQTKIIQKFSSPTSQQSSPNTPTGIQHSPGLHTLTQIQRLDTVDESYSSSFKRQQQKSSFLYHSSKYRHRTEGNFTNEGFSSSRLKTIYPSYKTSIENTEYEKQLKNLQFDCKYFNHSLNLLHIATKSIIDFLKQNDDKQKQSINRLDITTICKCFLSEELFDKYFQIYLLDILENKTSEINLSDDCGVFINYIFKNVLDLKQLIESRKGICNSFLNACEYLCRIIFEMHRNPNFLVSAKHKFKKTLLMTTINLGFQLVYLSANHLVEKFIIKYLNESVLHIMVIWFFDSDQNSCFQRNFFIFLYMFLNTAHQSLISTLFFKIGFISSLQNAYSRFFINGMKNDSNHENLFCFIQLSIQIILNALRKRQLIQLEKNLESMESWNILTNNKSYQEPRLLVHFNNKISFQYSDNMESISQKIISTNTKVYSLHEENSNKDKKNTDLLNQRKSLLFTPKLLPLSPGIPNKQKQQSVKS